MLAAEILIPKPNASFPTSYIYVSNRNDPHPEKDTIAIFDPKTMEMVGEVRTGLQHLRGMVFGGEDERWLVAGGAQGGGIKIFERVNGGKGLKEIAKNEEVEAPTGFLWK
jgi:6-phosphogluconolactonase (cycloisomerase 2 family)